MTGLLAFLQPAPHLPEIEDVEKMKGQYRYWRIRIFYSMFLGYAFYYFTRKSFTFAMPALMTELGFDKSQLGILGTILSLTYGFSKFTSGILSDRSNPRYFMAIGLILTGVFNIFFGLSSSLFFLALFWGLNGWFQGFGWPPCARFLTHWYSHSERGSWWSMWNVSHNLGGFIIPFLAAICAQYWGWRVAMYVPGVISIMGGFFLLNRLRDTPQSLGLPPIEKFRNDYVGAAIGSDGKEVELTTREILVKHVLKNKFIWILALASFFVYIIRTGINDWSALFLVESKGYSQLGASSCVSLFEVGGFCGSLTAGWSSDRLFKGKRGPVNAIFAGGMVIGVSLFWIVPPGYTYLDSLSMFCIGFAVFGPQMLIGVAAAELSHKKAAATATGFTGWFAYLGAATAGYPLGKIAQELGWYGFFATLAICCLAATSLLVFLWSLQTGAALKKATA